MAKWEGYVLTEKGRALNAKLIEGNTLSIVGVVSGAGYIEPAALKYLTAVVDVKQELTFATKSYPEEGRCAVPVKLTNAGVSEPYIATQIGVMAFDPDEGVILYLVSQATDKDGTEVPAESDLPGFSAEWTFYIEYGQADDVTVEVDPSNTLNEREVRMLISEHDAEEDPHAGVLARQEDLTAHINNQNNPHGVTKEQLGLDKVSNVPDSEKQVAFASEAATARKVKYGIIVRFNGGRTEGTDMWTYDGATSKSINITPEKIKALSTDGGTMEGDINMSSNRITQVGSPMDDYDAVPKYYVDDKRTIKYATIGTAWTGDAAPYTQTINVEGIQEEDKPHIFPMYSGDIVTKRAQREAWNMVSEIVTGEGVITVTCFDFLPEVEIPIQMEVHR